MDKATDTESAWEKAVRKVARRERSSYEIRAYLSLQGFTPETIESTLTRLRAVKYLDDHRLAEDLICRLGHRGKGLTYIQNRLEVKGLAIPDEQVLKLLAASTGKSDIERASELLRRRYPNLALDPHLKKRAASFLIRRGFDPGIALRASGVELEEDSGA